MTKQTSDDKEERKAAYDKMLEGFRKDIVTWADFFKLVDGKVKAFLACQCPSCASAALMVMYSFIKAMEEMPEEGDINNLVERMVHLIVYESEQKLGALCLITDEDRARATRAGALASALLGGNLIYALRRNAVGATDAETVEAPSMQDTGGGKKLH